jgi:hypothetical protein
MDGVAHVVCYEELTPFGLMKFGVEELASMSPQELMAFIRGLRLIATDVVWLVSCHRTDSAPSPGG